MYVDEISKILDKAKNEKIRIDTIELVNGILFQFTDDYVTTYLGGATTRTYVGRHPSIEVKSDIWGDKFVIISTNCIRIKPKAIEKIDYETIQD